MSGNNQELAALVQRLELVATRLENANAGADSKALVADDGDSSASVQAFDAIVSGPLASFMALSKKIGGEVSTHGEMIEAAFKAQRDFLCVAAKSKKPSDSVMPGLLKPTSDNISAIQDFREKGRRSQYFNHLSAVSESIPALGWVAVSPTPAPFVKEMKDAGQFYTDRVLRDWKDKSKTHVEWTRAWMTTITELQAYVKEHHTTGLVWNPKGGDATQATNGSAPPPSAGGPPPPPPPPPPPGLFDDVLNAAPKEDPADKARNALFADLNKGENVTKGLKKVTADMQTHKNPSLRAGGEVSAAAAAAKSAAPAVAPKPAALVSKPPKLELEGKRWNVEFQVKNPNIVISDTDVNQSVYVYKCEGSTIKVEGKINYITMDSCKKCAIVFDKVVSACEFINCQSVQMQVMGAVPTISVEKTDGCQMFLSKEAAATTEIISAKSSEMNVMIPTDDDDFVEVAIPEQFKTTIKGTKLSTVATESV